jgi:peptide/nickel transport system permease protein
MGNRMSALKRLLLFWQGLLAVGIILYYCLVALAAPLLAPQPSPDAPSDFRMVKVEQRSYPNPPAPDYPLGTFPTVGNSPTHVDVYYTLIWGARSAIIFGMVATLISATFGMLAGAISSFVGGTVAQAILRVTDAFLAFPIIAGVVLIGQMVFPVGLYNVPTPFQETLLRSGINSVVLGIIFFSWMPYTRIIYADMERIRHSEFIVAAQSIGARPARIIFRHLIPNSISNVIVLATRDVGGFVLLQATFSFLGVGGGSSWGELLAMGRTWILVQKGDPFYYWWVYLPVSLALVGFGFGWNLLGDFINDRLNPRLRDFIPD